MTDESEINGSVPAAPVPLPDELGAELARLRRKQKVTGQALAAELGISQGTISKIENGLLRPSPVDVARIAEALRVPADQRSRLLEQAVALQGIAARRPARRRIGPGGAPAHRQGVYITAEDYAGAENGAKHLRSFQPILVPGLLQISEYARRVVNGYHRIAIGGDEGAWFQQTASLVTLRMERQRILYDPTRTFDFILMESVLGNRFAPPEYMIAQVRRIAAAAELDNVTVRIVPSAADLKYPQVQGFDIMDDDMVVVETLEATGYRDPEPIRIYSEVFDEYAALSAPDLTGMIARYTAMYAELLAPGTEDD